MVELDYYVIAQTCAKEETAEWASPVVAVPKQKPFSSSELNCLPSYLL
jgi:hypothetical protein